MSPRRGGDRARRRVEHLLAAAVSGPPGRLAAFVVDFSLALGRGLRSRLGSGQPPSPLA